MFKKDAIFWWATAIFIMALLLAGIFKNQLFLFLMVGSYLLRPTLASLGLAKHLVDERQMSIQYRSGNIAFVVMIIACIILAVYLCLQEDHSWEFFNIAIILGLAGKALSNVILTGNYRDGAVKIVMTIGLLMALFELIEGGFALTSLVNAIPGLAIAGVGWLGRMFPRTIAGIVFLITIVLSGFVLAKGLTIGQIAITTIIAVPMITAGICLIIGDRDTPESNSTT
jgi:hypothetical protein